METLDDVKRQGLNRNPKIKTFKIPNTGSKDIMGLPEVKGLVKELTQSQSFKIHEFRVSEEYITVVIEIQPRTHILGI